jgi:succinate dehydrogenase / fumarate reductase flavoprotein subunit
LLHQELGDLMTRAATVVRYNNQLQEAVTKLDELQERATRCSLSDTGAWTNQNVIFTKSVQDMIPIAKCIVKGALSRDESRGAHFKPEFSLPAIKSESPAERRREAEAWCDHFEENNKRFLKSSIAKWDGEDVNISYEDVDTSLIEPRPRLYGLVGAEVIEQVWNERVVARGGKAHTGLTAAAV